MTVREEDEGRETYHVKLDSFTGPLDLLLHLIRKNELNIYDIPIALITQQYLDHLHLMKDLKLSLAGEFLVMAATLIQIKSRLLLPQDETDAGEEEELEDPRSELVHRLIEYQQYKEAASRLSEQEKLWREIFGREPIKSDLEPTPEVSLEDLSLFDLIDALQDVLARTQSEPIIDMTLDALTVQDRINAILEGLEHEPTVTFAMLFHEAKTKVFVIVTFLALLELVRMKLVRVYQAELFGPIQVRRNFLET